MTASLHRLGSGQEAGTYYTNDAQREAKPRNRDEYYARDGLGTWWSTGETVVRHGAAIDRASFRDLCAGYNPGTGKPLVRNAGPSHWAGLDVTFTPGKSISLLWAAGDPEQRTRIEAAHQAAVDEALRLIDREGYVLVRSGAGGKHKDRPTDVIVARYDHYTTREGDPNCHSHCVIMNVAGSAKISSRYKSAAHLTIEPDRIFHNQKLLGGAYRAALSARLAQEGFGFRPAGRGQVEIAGVPQDLIEIFSRRSHQIETKVGRNATGAQKEIAALSTRNSKEQVPTGPELEAHWAAQFAKAGVDPWSAALAPDRHREHHDRSRQAEPDVHHDLDPPEIAGETPVAIAASVLFRHESVITREALLERAFVKASLRGIGIASVYDEITRLEQDGTLVRLGPDQDVGNRWTTPPIARLEAEMLRAVYRPGERVWIEDHAVTAALAAAPHLSSEQQDVVRRAANTDGISIVEAGAGTGKTTAARAIVAAAQRSRLKLLGLAPSWVAADELAKSTAIETLAIAKWRYDRGQGKAPELDDRTLVLVDEAGMVSMRDMAAITTAAQQAGSKIVLLGDSRQLEAVPGGSALRAITEVVRQNAVMEAVRRQEVDWQRAASVVMARGDAELGLRAYAEHGHVEMVSGTAEAMNRTVQCWRDLRSIHGDDVLIITRRNDDAARLNRAVRDVLRAEKRLVGEEVALPSVNRENERVELVVAQGDVVRFGTTLPDLNIRNGNRGSIAAIRNDAAGAAVLRIVMEDGRTIEQPWQDFARRPLFGKQEPPRIVHAYAGTAYSVQGRTAAASVHFIGSAPDAREIYVALTRHRHDVRIVVEKDRLEAMCRQRQTDHRVAPTSSALQEHLFKEARQYSEKANVVDFVADRQAFVATGVVTAVDGMRDETRVSRLLRAARSLREALQFLSRLQVIVPRWRVVEADRERPIGRRTLSDIVDRLRGSPDLAVDPSRATGRDHGVER